MNKFQKIILGTGSLLMIFFGVVALSHPSTTLGAPFHNIQITPGGGSGSPLPSGQIFVGNILNVAAPVPMTGDVHISNAGVTTIQPNAVNYAKMQNISSTKKLLGSSSTTTPVQEIGLGTGLSISGTTLSSTSLSPSLTFNHVFVGNGINVATDVGMSGIINIIATGVTSFNANSFSSLNLANALTDETGAGLAVFDISPIFRNDITIGNALGSPFTGLTKFIGKTSGNVNLSVQDAAGNWTMKLPTTAGTPTQFLQTNGTGDTTWATAPGFANPMTTFGDIIYENVIPTPVRLPGNTSLTRKFLTQQGTGLISGVPAWNIITTADIPAAALTKVDDANVTMTLGGTPASALLQSASMTLGWNGTLARSRGGTGASTFVAAGIPENVATGDFLAQNGDITVVTATSPNDGVNHTYDASAYVTVTASTLTSVTVTLSWTDENGNARNHDFFGQGLTTAALAGLAAIPFPPQTIRVSPNTTIMITTKLVGATITYDVGGYIQRIS